MSVSVAPSRPTTSTRSGRRLRIHSKAADVASLSLEIESGPVHRAEDEVVVEVAAAAINPSDVKATLGLMPHAAWPRTPGRDFAGTVVEGPEELLGLEVWGSSGELGIQRDGSHGTHLVIGRDSVRAKPKALSLLEAGAVGVPFVTAWKGFERSGFPKPGETVAILGATGKVGQAAIQIATMLGARTFGVVRQEGSFDGHHSRPVEILAASGDAVADRIRDMTGGHGADIVFNTVGSPYFAAARRLLALDGRQILIATIERSVPFDILEFYRGRHTYVGIDTLALSTVESVSILAQLTPGFDSGALKPFPVLPSSVYPLERAAEAYAKVLGSTRDRLVLAPNGVR
jgi:NADPH:quinone reductase-like Zn-dependent oxidoreductase